MPQLASVARAGDGRDVMIVTATASGDITRQGGPDGFAGVPHTGVNFAFYPEGEVSDVQYLQMGHPGRRQRGCSRIWRQL